MSSKNANKDEQQPEKYGLKSTLAQSFAAIAQSFLCTGLGMSLSIPTLVIRDLYQRSNSDFSITIIEASWYGSVSFILIPFGCFASGILQEKFGKKRCMIIANVPSIIAWILLYSAKSSVFLCASAILIGFSVGFGATSTTSYVGEISEPRLRGTLGSLGSMATKFGSFFIFLMGSFFDWKTVALLNTSNPIICACLIYFIPESPIWLLAKGKTDEAERALCWLRGWVEPATIKHEFQQLIHYNDVSRTGGNNVQSAEKHEGLRAKLAQFKEPSVYKPMALIVVLFCVSYMVNLFPARPFITRIMTKIHLVDNQIELLVIIEALGGFGNIILVATVHRVGKRVLTFTTLLINSFMLISLGVYIIATKNYYMMPLPYVPISILCGIYFFAACGISCMPWMMLIEVFPNKSREMATSMCAAIASIILFVLTKLYLSIEIFFSLEYTMILFGCIGLIGMIYFYFNLPETRNKTLLEIEEYFAKN